MSKLIFMSATLLLSGCAWNLTLMPRDSGTTYTGQLQGNGMGSGTMTVNLDGVTCTGPAVRVASNQTFGFANTYGRNSNGTTGNAFSTFTVAGDNQVKAILSCSNGKGLRCDMTGRNSTAGGICVDDAGRLFDVLAIGK